MKINHQYGCCPQLSLKKYSILKSRIKKNEGFSNCCYKDILGNSTIGYGHLVKKNEDFFLTNVYSKKKLSRVFEKDFFKALSDYDKNYKKFNHPKNVEEVYIEMIFQLGIKKQKKFKKMNGHIKKGEVYMACLEMKNSLWYSQTPKRVDHLINILLKTNKNEQ